MRSYTAASLRAERAARSRSTARERRITPGTGARAAAEPGAAPRSGPGSTKKGDVFFRRGDEVVDVEAFYMLIHLDVKTLWVLYNIHVLFKREAFSPARHQIGTAPSLEVDSPQNSPRETPTSPSEA